MDAIHLAGPTAAGKSAVALDLAERLGGEIISVDSMQVYRGMDIGTAKPSADDRARVPHHLIDVADLTESFDAARFLRLAREAEQAIRSRAKVPIYCGGTGLYFNAILGGLNENTAPDPALRSELENTPLKNLLGELEQRDPKTFARIDRQNPRRVVRAIELLRTTGSAISHSRPDWSTAQPAGKWFALERPRADLNARIDARVDEMFARGLVRETEQLLTRGLAQNRTAMQALGYRQIVEHLQGMHTLSETVALVKQKTRQYAKRQMTWFRHQLPLTWISFHAEATPAQIAGKILSHLKTT